jgi:hypothetical protein
VIAYVDSSVVLRIILGQPDPLAEWPRLGRAISSELLRVECLRTFDRLRLRAALDDRTVAARRAALLETIDAIDLVALDGHVLARAAEPFPTLVGTLDALHLASAILVREEEPTIAFMTHDATLGLAAAATGFDVRGV